MSNKTTSLALTITCLFTSFMFSQPGTLDPTFGVGGKVMNNLGVNNQAYDSTIQPDGKIIVVGNTYSYAPGSSFSVTRYLTNGDLDLTFGDSGQVTTLIGDHCSAHSVALQGDGKIVVAGSTYAPSGNSLGTDIMIVRYNADGTLDMDFDGDGVKVMNINYTQQLNSVLLQANGKIIVGGCFSLLTNPNSDTFGMARFDSDGTLDTTFGANGYVYTPNIFRGEILDMAFIDNEDIIAVGRGFIIETYIMARYTSEGAVVSSFGSSNNGIVNVALNNIAQLNKCVISANNDIYAAGATYNDIKYNAFITKYNANGIIDATFGVDGLIIRDFGSTITGTAKASFGNDICIDNDNNLLVGYGVGATNDYDFGLESYNLSGNLNQSFGTGGYFTTTFGSGHEYFRTMLVQPDNKIVMAGNKGLQVLARINNPVELSNSNFNKNSKITVSPNPFNNADNLYLKINKSGNFSVDLIDFKGTTISSILRDKYIAIESDFEKMDLSAINLPNGLYFLKVRLDNQFVEVIKILKN